MRIATFDYYWVYKNDDRDCTSFSQYNLKDKVSVSLNYIHFKVTVIVLYIPMY